MNKNTIVCLVDRDEKTNQWKYLSQTERISGTTSPEFKKKFPLKFVDLAAKTLRFNVYDVPDGAKSIDDPYRLGSSLVPINTIAENAGVEFEYVLTHRDARKQVALESAKSTITVKVCVYHSAGLHSFMSLYLYLCIVIVCVCMVVFE